MASKNGSNLLNAISTGTGVLGSNLAAVGAKNAKKTATTTTKKKGTDKSADRVMGNMELITTGLVKGIGSGITQALGFGNGNDNSNNNNNSGPGSWGYGGGGYGGYGGGSNPGDTKDLIDNVLTPTTAAAIDAGKKKADQLANNFNLVNKANLANRNAAFTANNVQSDNEWWRSVYNPIIQTAMSINSRAGNALYSSTYDWLPEKIKWQEELGTDQVNSDWRENKYNAEREYVEAYNKGLADFLAKAADLESANRQVYLDYITQIANIDKDAAKKLIAQGATAKSTKAASDKTKAKQAVSGNQVWNKAPKWAQLNIYDQLKNKYKFKTAEFPDYIRTPNETNKVQGGRKTKAVDNGVASTDSASNVGYWSDRIKQTYRNR